MKNLIQKFLKDESGATMVEYAILVALISIAAIAIIVLVGNEVRDAFDKVQKCMVDPEHADCKPAAAAT